MVIETVVEYSPLGRFDAVKTSGNSELLGVEPDVWFSCNQVVVAGMLACKFMLEESLV